MERWHPSHIKTEKILVVRDKQDTREQQPQKERGSAEVKQSYADKVKAERRKAAQARIAAKKGGGSAPAAEKKSAKDTSKEASKLLSKKEPKKAVSPNYRPAKASGYDSYKRECKVTTQG